MSQRSASPLSALFARARRILERWPRNGGAGGPPPPPGVRGSRRASGKYQLRGSGGASPSQLWLRFGCLFERLEDAGLDGPAEAGKEPHEGLCHARHAGVTEVEGLAETRAAAPMV